MSPAVRISKKEKHKQEVFQLISEMATRHEVTSEEIFFWLLAYQIDNGQLTKNTIKAMREEFEAYHA